MSEYITFVGKDPDGNVLDLVVVALYRMDDNSLEVRDQFGPGTPYSGVPVVSVPTGTYYVNVEADGYRFAYRQQITVLPGAGPDGNHPTVFEFQATGTTKLPGSAVNCRVYGWIERSSPNSDLNVERQAHGTTYDDGPTRFHGRVAHSVWFERAGSTRVGEQRNLLDGSRVRVSVDRNGYYQAELVPNALYRVILPTVAGVRFLRTPDEGQEAEVESLVQQSLTVPLYNLV